MKMRKYFRKVSPQEQERPKCVACGGSGYYDDANPKTGKCPPCASYEGRGYDLPKQ